MYTTKIRTTWLWTSLWACNLEGLAKPLLQPGSSQRCCFILDILQSVQSSYSKRLIIVGKHCPKHNLSSGNIRAWCPAPPEFSKEKVSKTARTDKNWTFYGAANRKWKCTYGIMLQAQLYYKGIFCKRQNMTPSLSNLKERANIPCYVTSKRQWAHAFAFFRYCTASQVQ